MTQAVPKLNGKKWDMLSAEYKVAVKVYELTKKSKPKETAYYSKLIKLLNGNPSKVTISKALDNLLDVGFLKADWIIDPDTGKWIRAFMIAGEAEETIKGVYRHLHDNKKA